jgi:hypothetical protein
MKRYGWMALLGSLIAIALLAGAGYLVFQAGVAQGAAGGTAPQAIFGSGNLWTGILAILLLLFFARSIVRLVFFPFFASGMSRRFGGWGHHPGRWGWNEERPVPPFFKDWHERIHAGEDSAENKQGEG